MHISILYNHILVSETWNNPYLALRNLNMQAGVL